MPAHRLVADQLIVQRVLQARSNNPQLSVRPQGPHLYVDISDQGGHRHTLARVTEMGRDLFFASFRSHSGRWEPLPIQGDVSEVAEAVAKMLGPYLQLHTVADDGTLPPGL